MTKLDPIIAVKNVEASADWYYQIFGFKNLHGGKNFAVLATENNEIILCLHKWGEHNHPSLTEDSIPSGNGLLLYFRTTDLKMIKEKAIELGCQILEDIHLNTNSLKMEFSLKDPDGYYLTVSEYHIYEG